MLLAEVSWLRWHGTPVAVVEPDAGDLRAMGRVIGIDVLDEGRGDAVVRRVRSSTARRVRTGAITGLDVLSRSVALAA
jgi:hypothetical protein